VLLNNWVSDFVLDREKIRQLAIVVVYYAIAFMDDLRDRLANRVQLTTDGHRTYPEAVEGAFGSDVDYAMLIKLYGAAPEASQGRYSPCRVHRDTQDTDRRKSGP
jgi:hypothetical protein